MGRCLRSTKLRSALYVAANGRCQLCGTKLGPGWHADHIIPWVVTKRTNVHEMQALCRDCNLKKGCNMGISGPAVKRVNEAEKRTGLRAHQSQAVTIAKSMNESPMRSNCLFWIVPGGGKSWLPPLMLEQLPGWRIAWFVPRLALRHQAEYGTLADFKIEIRASGNEPDPSRGSRGFVSTHQSLAQNPELWRQELSRRRYLLVIDEVHHAKISRDGTPNELARAIDMLPYAGRVLMTGTLDTNDSTFIYGVNYHCAEGKYTPDFQNFAGHRIRYSRADALDEKAIVPVTFFNHDGPVEWKDVANDKEEGCVISEATREQESNAIFTALTTNVAGQILDRAVQHCFERGGKLLVVCHSQHAAKSYAKQLSSVFPTFLAITDNDEADRDIERFKRTPRSCLVTCAMAYEGLDDKEISHVACLTHIRSVPWIEQMIARAWRAKPGKQECFCFVPDDPRMQRVIERIREEQPSIIKEKTGDGPEGPKTVGERDELIVGMNGEVQEVRCLSLDGGEVPMTESQRELLQLATRLGINRDDQRLVSLLSEVGRPADPPQDPITTVRERETLYRQNIADLCRKADGQMERTEWGFHQGLLWKRTGKSITEMNIGELENALKIAANFSS